jgi:C4-dicarboxylate transporter
MEKDTTYTVNRQELIRLARESCEGNLKSSGNGRFSQGLLKKGGVSKKEATAKTTKATMVKPVKGKAVSSQEKKQIAIKSMLVRTICASAIFLAIVIIDKFNFTYKTFDRNMLKQVVQNNRVYDYAEKFFATLDSEKIVDVFNRLD